MSEELANIVTTPVDAGSVVVADFARRDLDPQQLKGARLDVYQAIITQAALDEIHAHGKSHRDVEICGVLVGNVYHDDNGPYLHIAASIRGDSARGYAAQVTFTADTWTHIQERMDRLYPDYRIVGWYHTHPGFGIFLSGMDLFIQDNFFNLPWQVAFVYDPLGGDEGLFIWRGGKCERVPFLIDLNKENALVANESPGHLSEGTLPPRVEPEEAPVSPAIEAPPEPQVPIVTKHAHAPAPRSDPTAPRASAPHRAAPHDPGFQAAFAASAAEQRRTRAGQRALAIGAA